MSSPYFGIDNPDSEYVPSEVVSDEDDENAELDDDMDDQESEDEPEEIEVDLAALFNDQTESSTTPAPSSGMLTSIQRMCSLALTVWTSARFDESHALRLSIEFLQRVAGSDGTLPPEIEALLRNANPRVTWQPAEEEDDDDDDEDDTTWGYFGNTRSNDDSWFPKVTEPNPSGQELLQGGEFGRLGPLLDERTSGGRKKSLGQRLRASKLSPRSANRQDLARVSPVLTRFLCEAR